MPGIFSSRYDQSKRDTDSVTTWLSRAAINAGYSSTKFIQLMRNREAEAEGGMGVKTAQQLRNAKKNAKKKAKAKEMKGQPRAEEDHNVQVQEVKDLDEHKPELEDETRPKTGKYKLPVQEYLNIAEYLASKAVPIAHEVLKQLRTCIHSRKRTSKRFAPDTPSSITHRYFIEALEQVEQLLAPGTPVPATNTVDPASSKSSTSTFNRFAALDLDEGLDNDEDQADIVLPEPPAPADGSAPSRATFAPEMSTEEAAWTIIDFFMDVVRIRDYIRELWLSYKAGEVDLITASVTTNTALELLREPYADMMATAAPVITGGVAHLQSVLFNSIIARYGRTRVAPLPLFAQVDERDQLAVDLYDFLLIPNAQIIMGFAGIMKEDSLPFYRPGHFGPYDPTFGERVGKGPQPSRFKAKWKASMVLLCESFLEYLSLLDAGRKVVPRSPSLFDDPSDDKPEANMFYIDEIACEMEAFRRNPKDMSLLLLIHSQIFIDINHALGSEASRGHADMKKGLASMRSSLVQRKSTEPNVPPETWPAEGEKLVAALHAEVEYWSRHDPVDGAKKAASKSIAVSESNFMARSPMLCGLILFRLRLRYQHLSFVLVNSWSNILSTAQLYLACKLYDKLPGQTGMRSWPDMDLVLELHGKESICGGYEIRTVEDAQAAYLKMMGYPAEVCEAVRNGDAGSERQLARAKRKLKWSLKPGSTSAAKGLTDRTQIIPIFQKRYLANSITRSKLDINAIQTLLRDLDREPASIKAMTSDATASSPKQRGKRKLRRQRKHKSPKFSIVQLLAVIEAGLAVETISLRFDYIAMHLRCIRVLNKVRASAHEYLVKKLGTGYLEHDAQLPVIVGWILSIAALADRNGRLTGMTAALQKAHAEGGGGGDGPVVASRLLVGAKEALNGYLADRKEARIEVERVGMR